MADTIDNNNVTGLSPSTPTKRSLTELNQPQTEKPFHYTYLKEFRVEQCQLFLQHKCTQHRPFTCFYWHFLNQRRRRPKRKKDGTFNYSPDVYCTFYNETSGECPHGDDCPYLHRVAGDVERRYHLRYYKTSPCVHETDARGYCVKNGPHCAFAHGPHDLRQPVYDVRELQAMEQEEKEGESKQIVPEDPRWNDTTYVLANYKTEPCKKPPRLCRQGYACPQYHNNRDRRRSPRKYKYRSTPCPNVKHGDEWGDPNGCENGDACAYCHTRTEQQFHPEIYKSTKCNDMQQTGHCPRGPFCAFAHVEQDGIAVMNTVLKSGSISIIPDKELLQRGLSSSSQHSSMGESPLASPASHQPGGPRPFRSSSTSATVVQYSSVTEHGTTCVPGPLSSSAPTYEKAPGSGRRSGSITSKDLDQHASFSSPPLGPLNLNEPRTPTTSDVSHFYPPSNTIESVVDHALGEFHFDDFDVSELEKELNEPSSLGSSLGGTTPIGGFNSLGSDPVSIPGNPHDTRHQSFTSQPSQSPTSPIGQVPPHFHHQHSNPAGYIRSPTGRGSQSSSFFDGVHMQSPKLPTPQLTSPLGLSSSSDLHRLSDENMSLRNKLASWEESWNQAKQACDAWKREANEQFEKAKQIDREKTQALIKLGEAEAGMRSLQHEIETRHGGPHIRVLKSVPELENLPLIELKQILNQLKVDIERLEKVISKKESMKCSLCEENQRNVVTFPCLHCVMCESCSSNQNECPFCHSQVTQKSIIFIPL